MVKIQEWGPSWQSGFFSNLYYDFDAGIWKWGIREPVMKEMAQYLIKLREEGILPPDYISMETKSWEELMSTDRGFITLDYIVRIDFFNLPNRLENPEYTLALMAPPKPDVPTGTQTLMKSNLNFAGYCVCNTGDEESQENAFRFVDWMYSDPAIELLSWGKENETYHIVDGKRKFILEGDEQPQNKYGIATYGLYQVLEVEANEATYTDEQVAACRQVLQYLEPQANPTMWMPFAEEEAQEAMDLKSALDSYTGEQLSQFLLGQKPMSEWDTFVKGLDDLHVDRLLEIYTQAYRRIVEK